MIVLGVDGGLSGGLALVAYGEVGTARYVRPFLLAIGDIPTKGEGAGCRVDVAAVLAWIRQYPPDHAFIEHAHAMPGQGVSGMFRYGRAVGALEACIQGLMIPMTLVEPVVWKKAHGLLKTDKEASRQKVLNLFPSWADKMGRKKDHGRAEAVLIAWHGLAQLRRMPDDTGTLL